MVRPGLTDSASVLFRDEESLLGAIDPEQREAYYITEILPRKLEMNLEYMRQAGFVDHISVIVKKALGIVLTGKSSAEGVRRTEGRSMGKTVCSGPLSRLRPALAAALV